MRVCLRIERVDRLVGGQFLGEDRKVGCKLLERTGRWEDKLAKLTSQKREKMRQKEKGHLSTKHNLLQLPALCDKVCQ